MMGELTIPMTKAERIILQKIEELQKSLAPKKLDRFLTLTEIKNRTGISYSYWKDLADKEILPARYFPGDGRKKGGYRVAESALVDFIQSPLFDIPKDQTGEGVNRVSIREIALRIIKQGEDGRN